MSHPLSEYGWHDRVAALYADHATEGARAARVVRSERGWCTVVTAGGQLRANPYALASRRAGMDLAPVTGDWVVVADDPDEGCVVTAVLPRWSAIVRKDPDEKVVAEQVLAANVDVAAAICALDRDFAENRLERMLAMVAESGATPVVLLTKADKAPDAAGAVAAATAIAGDAAVILTSVRTGAGIDDVRALLGSSNTLALIGPSGAGKSTLVNRVVGANVQKTGEVRAGDRRGRHTTTTRDLVPVPSGGVLLDTPGLRSLPLWSARSGLASTFADIEELAASCRFRDCAHDREPGCAVRAAAAGGQLDPRRLDSWHKLQHELAELEARRERRRS